MTTWLHEQRLDEACEAVRESNASSVLDLGCGDGDLLVCLMALPQIERIVGVDLCRASLDRLRNRLGAMEGECTAQAELVHGSLMESSALVGTFECVVLIETIEHIDPDRLSVLERTVFAEIRPATVIVTTPNARFNPLLGVPSGRFRHPDHRFEWDTVRFERWVRGVAARNGYDATCRDVGACHPVYRAASQMAVFKAVVRRDDRVGD